MAHAVSLASPVTILTATPLPWRVNTDSRTPSLGGSSIPTIPRKVISFSAFPDANPKTGHETKRKTLKSNKRNNNNDWFNVTLGSKDLGLRILLI